MLNRAVVLSPRVSPPKVSGCAAATAASNAAALSAQVGRRLPAPPHRESPVQEVLALVHEEFCLHDREGVLS